MNPEIEHVLQGWHRAITCDTIIKTWLKERVDAVREGLIARVPDGRHIAQIMINRGYLDLGPQLLPVKSKAPIKADSLKKSGFVYLQLKGNGTWISANQFLVFNVGVVNRKLQVRSLMVRSPVMNLQPNLKGVHFYDERQQNEWMNMCHSLKTSVETVKDCISLKSHTDCSNLDTLDAHLGKQCSLYSEEGKRLSISLAMLSSSELRSACRPIRMTLYPKKLYFHIFRKECLSLNLTWETHQIHLTATPKETPMFLSYTDQN